MLSVLMSLAVASGPERSLGAPDEGVPLPAFRGRPSDGLAPGAHRVAVIGRGTALGGTGLAVVTLLPSAICAFGGVGTPLCAASVIATGVGAVGAIAGLGIEGVGSASFLRKNRRAGRGPGNTVGVGLVVGGAGGMLVGMVAPDALGGLAGLGSLFVLGGVVTLDIQHEVLRHRTGVSVLPLVDPVRRQVGVSGRF